MLIAPELVRILGSQKYVDAIPAVTPILGAGFFAMAYNIPSTVEYYYGKTSFIAVGTVLAAVLNVATNAIFIPQYGYLAAAYTTLGSYMVYFIFHCIKLLVISIHHIAQLTHCFLSQRSVPAGHIISAGIYDPVRHNRCIRMCRSLS